MEFEKIQSLVLLITGILTGVGGLYTFLKMNKTNLTRDISEADS